nr:copper amine oxidase N-terminal domain-containing protein [Cohnella zeiphila]
MKRNLIAALILSLVLAAGLTPAAGARAAAASSANQAPHILSVLSDGTMLADNGTLWRPNDGNGLIQSRPLAVRSVSGTSAKGIGVLPDGSITGWTWDKDYGKIASASEVKQVFGSCWLKPDGTVWTYSLQTGKPEQVPDLADVAVLDIRGSNMGMVKSNGEIVYQSAGTQPVVWGKVPNAEEVSAVQVSGESIATLLRDGRVVIYNINDFGTNEGDSNYLKPIPVTVASDAADIALVDGETLLIKHKDGSVSLNHPEQTRSDNVSTTELEGISGVDRIVPSSGSVLMYARMDDGSWVAYGEDGKMSTLSIPYLQELAVMSMEKTKLQAGESIKPLFALKYSNGGKTVLTAKDARIAIAKPYLLKQLEDGSWKALAVGETTVTISAAGLSKTVTLSISRSKFLQGGKTVGGVTMLPMKTVFQTLGGTVAADAGAKRYTITVGKTQIKLTAGSKAATINGKNATLKAAVRTEQGQTYVPADLLSAALGAKLSWQAATQTLSIALGQATMSVSTYQPGQTTKTVSGLYTVPGKGQYAGYLLLKGHPYESTTAIYFQYNGEMIHTVLVDLRKVDLNRKVTWTDDYGYKHTNTVGQLRKLFAAFSNQYTDDWLLATFGDVYMDYLTPSIPSDRLIDQYLRETGQTQ